MTSGLSGTSSSLGLRKVGVKCKFIWMTVFSVSVVCTVLNEMSSEHYMKQ